MKNSCFCQLEAELRKGFIFFLFAGEMETFQIKQKAVLLGVLCRKHSVCLSSFQHLEGLAE